MKNKTLNDATNKNIQIDILQSLLISFIDLSLITKQSHWTLRGANFVAVHEMLDDFNEKLRDHYDEFAERISQLGGIPLGISQTISSQTMIEKFPVEIVKTSDHLRELSARYAFVANKIRKNIIDIGDENSADMLTGASRDLDKMLWFIESHLE